MTYGTQTPKLEALYELRSALQQERSNLLKTVHEKVVSPWETAGGCAVCLGHERVVTWSTMDGPGWTEYGPCDACTAQSRAAGRQPFSYWAGGYRAASPGDPTVEDLFKLPEFRTEAVLLNTYDFQLQMNRYEIDAEEDRLKVAYGKQIVVVRGRKVPLGTTGRCFWVGETKYGTRVGFETADGETMWTAKSNVAVAA